MLSEKQGKSSEIIFVLRMILEKKCPLGEEAKEDKVEYSPNI